MTARSDDPDVSPEAGAAGGEIWGTWEELLLACAVSRHGTGSWDSVAMEVQTRSPFAARLTPHRCRLRFRLLHRRFAGGAGAAENGGGDEDPDASVADGWVEELRRLRVAELRREVERYDLSIGSLQSKVQQLKEERERSLCGETKPEVKEEGKGSPEEVAREDRASGEVSGRSCEESNSTDLKPPEQRGDGAAAGGTDPAAKEEAATGEGAPKVEASGESVAESKEVEAEKESSDVQSSASLSRRRLRKDGHREEAEGEEMSVAPPAAESEPLIAFLQTIRANKLGSVFERRLESQESAEYRSTIRRHVDLEMIRAKLDGAAGSGPYYSSASEFYRDLLLLCSNAVVFFPRASSEHAAASHVRALVSKHISAALQKDNRPAVSDAALPHVLASKRPKTDADMSALLLEKAPPIIVCRKRSSIAKAAAAKEKTDKAEAEKKENDSEEKAVPAAKDKARGLRTNKSRGPVKNSSNATPNQKQAKAVESAAATEGTRSDKKSGGSSSTGGPTKKRNAVDFLNRMNQNSSPSTERVSLLETLKRSAVSDQKKSGRGDGRKETGGSGSKKATETAPTKRSVGRPPKRAAAPVTPPPSKRAKEDTSGKSSSRKRGKK